MSCHLNGTRTLYRITLYPIEPLPWSIMHLRCRGLRWSQFLLIQCNSVQFARYSFVPISSKKFLAIFLMGNYPGPPSLSFEWTNPAQGVRPFPLHVLSYLGHLWVDVGHLAAQLLYLAHGSLLLCLVRSFATQHLVVGINLWQEFSGQRGAPPGGNAGACEAPVCS